MWLRGGDAGQGAGAETVTVTYYVLPDEELVEETIVITSGYKSLQVILVFCTSFLMSHCF